MIAVACDYPEFGFRSKPSPTTTTPMGGAGGSGASGMGGGGAPTTTTTDTTSTTTSDAGGAPPVCSPIGQQGGCQPGQKCAVINVTTGEVGCTGFGGVLDYALCGANEECGLSSWCDSTTGVCKPICTDSAQCGSGTGALCVNAQNGGLAIPGLKVCTAHCHPTQLTPCGPDVSCVHPGNPDDFDCYASGGKILQCSSFAECLPGLVCAPDGYCAEWCDSSILGQCCGSCVLFLCDRCQVLPYSYGGAPVYACYTDTC